MINNFIFFIQIFPIRLKHCLHLPWRTLFYKKGKPINRERDEQNNSIKKKFVMIFQYPVISYWENDFIIYYFHTFESKEKKYIIPIPFIRNAKTVSSTCCFFSYRFLVCPFYSDFGFIVNNFSNENIKQFFFVVFLGTILMMER